MTSLTGSATLSQLNGQIRQLLEICKWFKVGILAVEANCRYRNPAPRCLDRLFIVDKGSAKSIGSSNRSPIFVQQTKTKPIWQLTLRRIITIMTKIRLRQLEDNATFWFASKCGTLCLSVCLLLFDLKIHLSWKNSSVGRYGRMRLTQQCWNDYALSFDLLNVDLLAVANNILHGDYLTPWRLNCRFFLQMFFFKITPENS